MVLAVWINVICTVCLQWIHTAVQHWSENQLAIYSIVSLSVFIFSHPISHHCTQWQRQISGERQPVQSKLAFKSRWLCVQSRRHFNLDSSILPEPKQSRVQPESSLLLPTGSNKKNHYEPYGITQLISATVNNHPSAKFSTSCLWRTTAWRGGCSVSNAIGKHGKKAASSCPWYHSSFWGETELFPLKSFPFTEPLMMCH